ncbi:MAG: bifunctional hydroxymethylpyrimidine kinase/phosphomethylpyrimidine kinase [Deltaproteobacteria bacterium]|nr:MAG: bifunctional hydroxymethylpyrimidine kinase/phosphomethylpyrimidine kinase [Deltaproteobacteria bacterium]
MTHGPFDPEAARLAALTIAGSDSGGGAGLQADLRTFFAHGLLGCTAVTAVTVQNTVGVRSVTPMDAALVVAQIEAVLDDLPVRAAKTGMLATAANVRAVAALWERHDDVPLVIDPVLVSTSGARLVDDAALEAFKAELLPFAAVVTPNIPEAAALLGVDTLGPVEETLEGLAALAPRAAVVLKGGHAEDPDVAVDHVRFRGGDTLALSAPRVSTTATHGTGCTFAAAITARLALGRTVDDAISGAKRYLNGALRNATPIGAGHGPVDHLWFLRRER